MNLRQKIVYPMLVIGGIMHFGGIIKSVSNSKEISKLSEGQINQISVIQNRNKEITDKIEESDSFPITSFIMEAYKNPDLNIQDYIKENISAEAIKLYGEKDSLDREYNRLKNMPEVLAKKSKIESLSKSRVASLEFAFYGTFPFAVGMGLGPVADLVYSIMGRKRRKEKKDKTKTK